MTSNIRRLTVVTAALFLPAVAGAAPLVELTASFDIETFGIFPRNTSTDQFLAPDLAAWDVAGRTGFATRGPLTYASFPAERHEIRTEFTQPLAADATLRTYVRSSGYYYTSAPNTALAEVNITNQLAVVNPTNRAVGLILVHHTHGIVASGGTANSSKSSVKETVVVRTPTGDQMYAASAEVYYPGNSPGATLLRVATGDWAGSSTPTTINIGGFLDDLPALEIERFRRFQVTDLAPNATTTFSIEFSGEYKIASSGSSTLSIGVIDFSNTAEFEYHAVDAVTGEPVPEVTFAVIGSVVPEPSAAVVLLGGTFLAAGRRRRA